MLILPAIDLRGGNCVRLVKGDFKQETIYSEHPEEIALRWEGEGAEFLHVVDLDGALAGEPQNMDAIKRILQAVKIPVEVGGGIRSMESIDRLQTKCAEFFRKLYCRYAARFFPSIRCDNSLLRINANDDTISVCAACLLYQFLFMHGN